MPNKRILAVVTNHREYPTRDDHTGLWFGELIHFYHPLDKAGYQIDIISPQGGAIPLDERSLSFLFMGKLEKQYQADTAFMEKLNHSLKPEDINPADYDAIYYTGGHGTMWDFPDAESLQAISRQIYENGGIVSAVCHGVAGLLNIRLSDGRYLVADQPVTGYSTFEEILAGVKNDVPYLLEDELKARGAQYKKSFLPFTPFVRSESRLITGQNPQSTKAVAKAVLKQLENDS
jgi:putative intracellular protease/amidase